MKMSHFPHYCGGRILVGLYNFPGIVKMDPRTGYQIRVPLDGDQFVAEMISHNEKAGYIRGYGNGDHTVLANHNPQPAPNLGVLDPFQYVPNDLDTFKRILKMMMHGHEVGVITCVTNAGQTNAIAHLEASGFDKSCFTNKSGPSDTYGCTHWHGDWHRKVAPAIGAKPFCRG